MKMSKITAKYQATIPKEIRDRLKIQAGDMIAFMVGKNGTVTITKVKPFDKEYLHGVFNTLYEWNSKEDDEAYEHLQDL